jgi:hypothetical protein
MTSRSSMGHSGARCGYPRVIVEKSMDVHRVDSREKRGSMFWEVQDDK